MEKTEEKGVENAEGNLYEREDMLTEPDICTRESWVSWGVEAAVRTMGAEEALSEAWMDMFVRSNAWVTATVTSGEMETERVMEVSEESWLRAAEREAQSVSVVPQMFSEEEEEEEEEAELSSLPAEMTTSSSMPVPL